MQGNQRQAGVSIEYLAGIIDGEGCIRIGRTFGPKATRERRNPVYYASVTVRMTDKRIPHLLCAFFGVGSVRKETPKSKIGKGWQTIYCWAVTSRLEVAVVLEKLLPYLIVKYEHAYTVLGFCRAWKRVGLNQYWRNRSLDDAYLEYSQREESYQKMRKLNAVGAAATTEREDSERRSDSLNSRETMRGGAEEPLPPVAIFAVGQ